MQISQVSTTNVVLSRQVALRPAQKFIADMVAPILPVELKTSYFGRLDAASNVYRLWDVKRPATGVSARLAYGWDRPVAYDCEDYSTTVPVPIEVQASDNAILARLGTHAGLASESIRTQVEKELLDVIVATCTGSLTQAVTAGNAFTNGTSDVIAYLDSEFENMQALCGVRPTTVVMGRPAFRALSQHASFQQRAGEGAIEVQAADGLADKLARILGVQKVLIGDATYNSAAEGATASHSFIWSDYCLLLYQEEVAEISLNPFLQPAWVAADNLASAAQGGSGGVVEGGWRVGYRYDPNVKSTLVEVDSWRDICATQEAGATSLCARLLSNCVQ